MKNISNNLIIAISISTVIALVSGCNNSSGGGSSTGGGGSIIGKTYYVSPTGAGGKTGTDEANAITLQAAADLTAPGDTVYLLDGTYTNATAGSVVLEISNSGISAAPITYKAAPNHNPLISLSNNWEGILVSGASYIVIDGISIEGNALDITIAEAIAAGYPPSPGYTTANVGIGVKKNGSNNPHHIIVQNCNIHHCSGAGLEAINADYIVFKNNIVHSNAWWSSYGDSGINMFQFINFDFASGYHNYITANYVYDNEEFVNEGNSGKILDGNGIIIDSFSDGGYTGKTLISNNIVFSNGGRGIEVFKSVNVDVVNNTTYQNMRSTSPDINDGELYANTTSNVRFINNIAYARGSRYVVGGDSSPDIVFDYNIYNVSPEPRITRGSHDRVGDPLFVNGSNDAAYADFHLLTGSLGINSGEAFTEVTTDFSGTARPQGSACDRGAYEQ